MHGSFFVFLQKFILKEMGSGSWAEILKIAGYPQSEIFLTLDKRSVKDFLTLINAVGQVSPLDKLDFFKKFGVFIGLTFMNHYSDFFNPIWKTLDVIENKNSQIHQFLKFDESSATPAHLKIKRLGQKKLHISYSSPRKMCTLGVGMIQGVAAHFKENVKISQSECMLNGCSSCEIQVDVLD